MFTDYRGGSGVAAVTGADESRSAYGTAVTQAAGKSFGLACDPQTTYAPSMHACNSPPIYKLVSSYII